MGEDDGRWPQAEDYRNCHGELARLRQLLHWCGSRGRLIGQKQAWKHLYDLFGYDWPSITPLFAPMERSGELVKIEEDRVRTSKRRTGAKYILAEYLHKTEPIGFELYPKKRSKP